MATATKPDADVGNAHTPRTEAAREAISNQLENGSGAIETGDASTSPNYAEVPSLEPTPIERPTPGRALRAKATAANK